jgi:DNA polymerase type B, organellar and viral
MAGMTTKPKFIMLKAEAIERGQRLRERDRLYSAAQRYRYPGKDHKARRRKNITHEFIMWDGESPQDAGYAFFANSKGKFLLGKFLSTEDCLQLIYETEREYPDAIHIGFGFNLDVSYILKDLPRRQLTALHHTKRTVWNEWEIEHIPHKWVRVKRGRVVCKIYDIRSFCPGAYVPSLQRFDVGTSDQLRRLAEDKARRSEFVWADIEEIAEYCRLELSLGPGLGNAIRDRLARASYVPKSWHGPGAVARMAFQRHGVYKAMAKCPTEVRLAARYAFIGGRFNQFLIGWMQRDVYEADLNSAYPYYATQLPNLNKGKWRHGKKYEAGKFAVYHIRYQAKPNRLGLYPLPRRMENYGVVWPHVTEGWYWAPEAELVKDDPGAEFIEALIFDEDDPTDRPFAFLFEYFQRRKDADRRGDPIGYAFKIIINAIYGQLAQRAGWDRKKNKPPKTHQLEWAGYITSGCRAAVYKAAVACGDDLISINTDSIQALCPLDDIVEEGDQLGQWKITKYCDGIMWQAGIYFLRTDLGYDPELGYGWNKAKTRGIPRGHYQPEDLIKAMDTGEPLRMMHKQFIPYTLADNGMWDQLNTWVEEERVYEFGGTGYRRHRTAPKGSKLYGKYCKANCNGTIHRTSLLLLSFYTAEDDYNIWSKPHYLPWIDGPDPIKLTAEDILLWDINELDAQDEWMLEYQVREVA